MANQITGRIDYIGDITYLPSKDGTKQFMRREIAIDATRFDTYTGERGYENYPLLEFSGDKCADLNHFNLGQIVTVTFDLSGVKYLDKDGKTRYFSRIRAYKIEEVGSKQVNYQANKTIESNPIHAQNYDQPKDDGLPF
jgi:hypothetical protein